MNSKKDTELRSRAVGRTLWGRLAVASLVAWFVYHGWV